MTSAPAEAQARRVEVRLLRRLPADAAGLRGRAARRWPARSTSPTSPRRPAPSSSGPYDVSLVEGSITTARRRRADPAGPRAVAPVWSRSAPARPPAASRRCATSPTSTSSARSSTPTPSTSRRWTRSTPIAAHVTVDFELRGCPIDKHQLLEVLAALLARAAGRGLPDAQRVRRVQAARQRLRARSPTGTPCLGPVTQAGCGALCPAFDRGCYGCFGPQDTAQRRRADRPAAARTAWPRREVVRVFRDLQRRRAGVPRDASRPGASDAGERRTSMTDRGDGPARRRRWPGSRARARCTSRCATGGSTDVQLQHLRAAAVLRGLPARPRVHRAARHHRADLRHLPGRLPDERVPGDRGRLRGHGRRRRSRRCAGCSTAASGSRATRCTSTCCTRRTSSATTSAIDLARRPPRPSSSAACG